MFTRIDNDSNGNPRYVCNHIEVLTNDEASTLSVWVNSKNGISKRYARAISKAKTIGGKKYHTKDFGGGLVFQAVNIKDLENQIKELAK